MEINNHNLEIAPKNKPYLHIAIQPETKHRFRYVTENGSHGVVPGRKIKGKKRYPTVELVNYNGSSGDIYIRVSLCTNKKTEHVMQFREKKSSNLKSYIIADLDRNFHAEFKDLVIAKLKEAEAYQVLRDRKIKSLGKKLSKSEREKFEKEHSEDIRKEVKEISNSVVLKFEAFKKLDGRPDVQICDSIYSDPIFNLSELKIFRMSKMTGSCNGGEDVILLCSKVQKDNVKIKFFEVDENEDRWEAYASFSPVDVHYQFAISFTTPPYKANVEKEVAVCLEQGGEMSEWRPFSYKPDDCISKKRKICAIDETLKLMPSSTDDSSPSFSTGVVPNDMLENSDAFLETRTLQELQSLSSITEIPPPDSNSSSQQDLDFPSRFLGLESLKEFELNLDLLSDAVDYFGGMLDNEPINQSSSSILIPHSALHEADGTAMDVGKLERQMHVGRPLGQMYDGKPVRQTDVGKLIGQIDTMGIEDSEDEIPKKEPKRELKNKILEDQRAKLEQLILYIGKKDEDGNTLLHLAVLYNKNIRKILRVIKMTNSDIINAQNNNKQTALHIAVEKNSAAVKELLQSSANPSIKNAKGDNCCHIACWHNFVNCLKYILYPRLCYTLILDDFNYEGLTPVHIALKSKSLSCLDFLFEEFHYMIDFSAVDINLSQTFLHYAVRYLPSYVSRLLKEDKIEIDCIDNEGNTPLHIACAIGNYEVVKELIIAGADPRRNFKHNDSISDEEDSADEAWMGQTPADLTTNSNILSLLKSEDSYLSDSNEDKESDKIFEELAKNLSSLLDPDMRWKQLAVYVLDEEYVTSLIKCCQNPTKTILDYMKKTYGKQYIEQLIAVLDMVGLIDAVKVIKDSCKLQTVI